MKPSSWTLYIITDTGRVVPHWTATTRQECRNLLASIRRTPSCRKVRAEIVSDVEIARRINDGILNGGK